MQVYFLKTISGVGEKHTVADVQPGYARNFLFPRKFAVPVTPDVLARVKQEEKAQVHSQAEKQKKETQLLSKLHGMSITLRERADGDHLFGSVTKDTLQQALGTQLRVHVPIDALTLKAPLRTVGAHSVTVVFPSGSEVVKVLIQTYEKR